ncbi:MAG: nucleotidyl transferase AbiEii/AbiGii toxin family protein [Thermoleophilaceae bacterium]|nr:nucleotidyl transferase AbiEii/AbiGii toxin family protein [Thermoleophilaceae bacterium]
MSGPAFDQLLRQLSDAGVRFVLVGGLAVNAWGVVRGTKDVDIVVAAELENFERIARVAVALHGHVQGPDVLLSSESSIAARLSQGEQVVIETELGRLDIVQGLDGVPAYEELRPKAIEADVLGVTIPVSGLEDLRAMKRAAGGTRDLADLEDLEAAHSENQ